MHTRYLDMLIVLTRLAASTLIVPFALVAGMLSFPTTCTCGADQPHQHPLFGVAGHHHGGQRTTAGGPDTEIIRAGGVSLTTQTTAESAAPSLTAVQTAESRLQSLPRASMLNDGVQILDGLSAMPDVPPPRA